MEHPPIDFDTISEPLEVRVTAGLAKVAAALRARAWKSATLAGLTPTQGQALALLRDEPVGLRLSTLAAALEVSPATASDAVGTLVGKDLVVRAVDPADRRAAAFRLTSAGGRLADEAARWSDFLAQAALTLDPQEQAILYRALVKLIRAMQEAGDIATQRLCVTCRFFRPNVRPDDPRRPHVCAFVGAPFGDRHLRLDCREQQPAPADEREALWRRFADVIPTPATNEGDRL